MRATSAPPAGSRPARWPPPAWPEAVHRVADWLARIIALLLGFDVVPALPLDGGRAREWYRPCAVKKALVYAVVLLLVVIGLPLLMPGMGAVPCSDCVPAIPLGAMCVAVLAAAASAASAAAARQLRLEPLPWLDRLVPSRLERPPQLVLAR